MNVEDIVRNKLVEEGITDIVPYIRTVYQGECQGSALSLLVNVNDVVYRLAYCSGYTYMSPDCFYGMQKGGEFLCGPDHLINNDLYKDIVDKTGGFGEMVCDFKTLVKIIKTSRNG